METVYFLFVSCGHCFGSFLLSKHPSFPADHVHFLSYQDRSDLKAVEGTIDTDVQMKPTSFGTKYVFELEIAQIKIEDHWQSAKGRILVNLYQPLTLDYGNSVRLEGTLYKAFSSPLNRFSYQRYLEDHGLFFSLSVGKSKHVDILSGGHGQWWFALAFSIKHQFKSILSKYLEPLETSMIQAMVLGDRSLMTKDIYALFSKTGTSHILAISGMNMALISAIVLFILKTLRCPRMIQFILTGIFLLVYALISGLSASVIRSVLMAIVILSSFCIEQEADTANSLGLAALILLTLNPANFFDIGFQLSFICVLILILFYPLIQTVINHYVQGKVLSWLAQGFAVSLVAWAGISPLIAYEYDIVSPVAIIANIPIVPLADLTIALSLGVVALGLCCPWLALAFAGALKAVFNFILILTSWFAQVPGGYFYLHNIALWQVVIYYFCLGGLYLFLSYRLQNKFLAH
jgi:competence protein ComEC